MSSVQIQFIARAFIFFSLHFAFLLYKKEQKNNNTQNQFWEQLQNCTQSLLRQL